MAHINARVGLSDEFGGNEALLKKRKKSAIAPPIHQLVRQREKERISVENKLMYSKIINSKATLSKSKMDVDHNSRKGLLQMISKTNNLKKLVQQQIQHTASLASLHSSNEDCATQKILKKNVSQSPFRSD
jgi:hypothetical protein